MLVLYYSQISQYRYTLYLEKTVPEIVTLCKFGTLILRVVSCNTRILKTVRNDLCSQAALRQHQSNENAMKHCKIQNPVDLRINLLSLSHYSVTVTQTI